MELSYPLPRFAGEGEGGGCAIFDTEQPPP